jgi:hypothetical protein
MRTLILNQSNIVPNTFNSRLEYTFPAGNVHIQKGQKLALASLEMYYSTFNITSVNNNNKFNYVWVDGSLVEVTIPDGYYTIATLNEFLQFTMIQNLHYLVDNDTQNFVYFLSLGTNASTYKIELTTFLMNATLFVIGTGAGEYTFPAGATWQVPNNNIVPMFQLLPNNFRNVIGFSNAGYYPTGASGNYAQAIITGTPPNQVQTGAGTPYTGNIVFSSNSVPQVSPLSSFLLKCNLINNNYAVPNDLLYSFSPQADFGQQFTIAPNQLIFINIQEGQYNKFQVEFADQNNQPVAIVDPNFVILLIISDEGDIGVS